jgi:hypothetical protein
MLHGWHIRAGGRFFDVNLARKIEMEADRALCFTLNLLLADIRFG